MGRVTGVDEHRAALRRLPEALKADVAERLKTAADKTRDDGRALIKARFKKRTGAMLRLYRSSVSKAALTARVGYLSASSRRKVFYARFLHDGTVKIEGYPFHDRALDQNEDEFYDSCDQGLREVLAREGF